MEKKNKGFTLIELLAVIVILGVLLAIAIPAVSKYINTAKKSTYKENVQSYAKAAKNEFMNIGSEYQLPVDKGDATVITFEELKDAIENGGKVSSYNNKFKEDNSCVIIVQDGTTNDPHYTYYIAAMDEKGYSIGSDQNATVIAYDKIEEKNIIQTSGAGINCKSLDSISTDINAAYTETSFQLSRLYNKEGQLLGTVTPDPTNP